MDKWTLENIKSVSECNLHSTLNCEPSTDRVHWQSAFFTVSDYCLTQF